MDTREVLVVECGESVEGRLLSVLTEWSIVHSGRLRRRGRRFPTPSTQSRNGLSTRLTSAEEVVKVLRSRRRPNVTRPGKRSDHLLPTFSPTCRLRPLAASDTRFGLEQGRESREG